MRRRRRSASVQVDPLAYVREEIAREHSAFAAAGGVVTGERMGKDARTGRIEESARLPNDAGDDAREDIAHAGRCHARIAVVTDAGHVADVADERAGALEHDHATVALEHTRDGT